MAVQWGRQWAEHLEFLEDSAEEQGFEPPALRDRPLLTEEQQDYLDAFLMLSGGRPIGMCPSGIPMTDIEAFCRLFHVEDPGRFSRFMRAMDAEWLSFEAERVKSGG